MSITSHHRKKDSGELDVFEAARYFSGANEIGPGPENCRFNFPQKSGPGKKSSASRRSLDMPIIITNPTGNSALDRKRLDGDKKSCKQPSSPGGRLIANFINSIFNQTGSKKKKKSGRNGETDQSTGESRQRRSSISHLRIITNSHDSKLPDFYAKTPTKSSYKDLFRKYSVSGPGNVEDLAAERRRANADEKSRFGSRNFGLSSRKNNPTATVWADGDQERDGCFRKFNDEDDGDSDSSSDLFDLPINGPQVSDFFSNGLPVYGTTRVVV